MGLLSTIGAASGRAFGFTRSAIAQAVSDAYFNLTTLLLPGNGTNGAQNNTFLDSSSNGFTITRNPSTGPNAPTQGTFSPFSQTGWSGFFDGTGDYVTVANNADFQFGTGDFTVEYWVYFTSTLSTTSFFPLACWAANSGYELYYRGSSPAGFAWYYNSSVLTTGFVPAANRWYHVACTRASGTTRVFVDGAIQATLNSDTSNLSPTTSLILGAETATTGTTFPGYISNVRVIKGAAAYTSAFTPSTTNLGIFGSGTTSLLTLQSNRFIDNGSNPKTVTPTNAAIQAFSPFAPTAAYSAATNGGSGYFDGAGDYLTWSGSSVTTAFTFECWFYYTGTFSAVAAFVGPGTAVTNALNLYINNSTQLTFDQYGVTATSFTVPTMTANQWYHVAFVRNSSNSATVFLNGVRSSTGAVTISTSFANIASIGYVSSAVPRPWIGYLSGVKYSQSAVYDPTQTTITIPTAPPSSSGATLLLNFTNAGITDATAKNDLETVGSAQISTTQSKFGGSSMSFNGTNSYLRSYQKQMFQFQGNFTIEVWVYMNSLKNFNVILDTRLTSSSTSGIAIGNTSAGNFYVDSGSGRLITSSSTYSANTWYYVALVRSGSTVTLYVDGASAGTGTSSNAFTDGNGVIGTDNIVGGTSYFNGYMDDFRITVGFARTITTPTSAFALQ